jgi:hypothetical protein
MPARLPSCTAFVPVHDEEASVVAVAEGLLAVLPEVADAWDLVLVDDGSRDGTAALVDRLAATRDGVRVVRHPTNRGYGAAVRSGLAASRFELSSSPTATGSSIPPFSPTSCTRSATPTSWSAGARRAPTRGGAAY